MHREFPTLPCRAHRYTTGHPTENRGAERQLATERLQDGNDGFKKSSMAESAPAFNEVSPGWRNRIELHQTGLSNYCTWRVLGERIEETASRAHLRTAAADKSGAATCLLVRRYHLWQSVASVSMRFPPAPGGWKGSRFAICRLRRLLLAIFPTGCLAACGS